MNWLWPKINDETSAKDAALRSSGFAFFVAGVTAFLAIITLFVHHPIIGLDGSALVDATLFAVVGWRLRRFSFPWALAGLVLYSAEIVFNLTEGHTPGILGILILLAFMSGLRGTLFIRKLSGKQEDPISDSERIVTWEP